MMYKILFFFFLITNLLCGQSQTTTRIFYELTYKPQKDSSRTEKTLTILDISDKISLYRDYDIVSQDSVLMQMAEKMNKSGVFFDAGKSIKWPKFTYKVKKDYINKNTIFIDGIFQKYFSYTENINFDWKISSDIDTISGFPTQKAMTNFGGRNWIAWFTKDIPYQDGPYKFYGLPGLILKIEDSNKNYSWLMVGIKKINDFSELSFTEKISGFTNDIINVSKGKFYKSYNAFKKDPFAEARLNISPQMRSSKMPGSDITVGELLQQQEERVRKFFNENNNSIEINNPKN